MIVSSIVPATASYIPLPQATPVLNCDTFRQELTVHPTVYAKSIIDFRPRKFGFLQPPHLLTMLLSSVASALLALLITVTHATPLTSPASNRSTNLLLGRGLDSCSVLGQIAHRELGGKSNNYNLIPYGCLMNLIVALIDECSRKSRDSNNEVYWWHKTDSDYAKVYKQFEAVLWQRFPEMEVHLKRVFHVVLKTRLYEIDSLGQAIDTTIGGVGQLNGVEIEIARIVLWRETLVRNSFNDFWLEKLNSDLDELVDIWHDRFNHPLVAPKPELEAAYEWQRRALAERAASYNALAPDATPDRFVFYPTYIEPPVGEDAVVEAYIQSHIRKYLALEGFQTDDIELLVYLDNFLDREARPTGPQMLIPERISLLGRYARLQCLFQALWYRHYKSRLYIMWPRTYRHDEPGHKEMNVLEAELSRKWALAAAYESRSPIDSVHCLISIVRLWEAWDVARNAGIFVPDTDTILEMRSARDIAIFRLQNHLLKVNNEHKLPQELRDDVLQVTGPIDPNIVLLERMRLVS